MSALIELNQVRKDYGRFRALHDVTMHVGAGVTGLLGPNGAGKSTLIKLLLGLVQKTSGGGSILGYPIGTDATEIRSQVGYMPEDDCFLHGLSGIESVKVAGGLSRLPAYESLRRGHEILDFCGMGQERYRPVETYSTGMRQKLRFAMALVHDPRLLILDEPTSGLDPEERDAMLSRIQVLAKRFGKTIILCTHILPDVQVVCDSVVILAAGRVRLQGKLDDLLTAATEGVWTMKVGGDGDRLKQVIAESGCEITVDGQTGWQVRNAPEGFPDLVWNAAAETGTAIHNLQPSRSSLEDVFLASVRESRRADS